MSLGLLLPAGLAALAALLLPLLIHLSRQSEQKLTDFAALRWLSAQPRPRQRLRFEDVLLLLVRLLLVAALALLLARPVLFGSTGDTPWVLVAPGSDIFRAKTLVDNPDAQWRWLAIGFPGLDAPVPTGPQPLASLLREMDADLPANTPVTVIVPEEINGLDAARIRLSRKLDWRVLPGAAVAPAAASVTPAPTLVVRHAPDRAASLRYLRAAAVAWRMTDTVAGKSSENKPATDIAAVSQPLPVDARWLVWLTADTLAPDVRRWVESGGIALLDARTPWPAAARGAAQWRNGHGDVLAQAAALGRGRVVQWRQPLLPEALPELLEPEFPDQLRGLFEGPLPAPQRALAASVRPLPGGPGFPETPRPLQPWLIMAIVALFVVERWLASLPRRRASA